MEEDRISFRCGRCLTEMDGEPALVTARGNSICSNCSEFYSECPDCDEWYRNVDLVAIRGLSQLVCERCRRNYVDCAWCGVTQLADDLEDDLCAHCADEVTRCDECGDRYHMDNLRNGMCRYCRRGSNGGIYQSGRSGVMSGMATAMFPHARTVGIELEMVVNDTMPHDEVPTGWCSTKEDGSIEYDDDQLGVEAVTRPLQGASISEGIMAVTRAFAGHAEVNSSCGLHVHVGAVDLDEDARRAVFNWWQATEPIWWLLVDEDRSCNSYCRSLEGWSYSRACEDRYSALNFSAWWKHGTLEFRLHEGTLNAKEIEMFAATAALFVDVAPTLPMPDNWGSLTEKERRDFFLTNFCPEPARDYMATRLVLY